MKRMLAYQKMLNQNAAKTMNETRVLLIMLLGVATGAGSMFAGQVVGYDVNLSTWLFLGLCYGGAIMIGNADSQMIRTLPVSDAFAVASGVFGIPVFIAGYVIPPLLFFLLIWGSVVERGFGWISVVRDMDIMGYLFALVTVAGIWFWVSIGAFHRDPKRRRMWYILECVVILSALAVLSSVLKAMGIVVRFSLSDLTGVFDPAAVMSAGAVFAVGSGVIAWKWNLRLYKADVRGQAGVGDDRGQMEEQYIADINQMLSKKGRRSRSVLLLLTVLTAAAVIMGLLGFFGFFDESEKVDIVTADPLQYTEWNSYGKEMRIEEIWEDGEIIFPGDMNPAYIDEYYVNVHGSYEKGDEVSWTSIAKLRYMVATFPEEEYRKEKERIAGLSVTCDEDGVSGTNRVLHDTEHFVTEAYIAVYQEGSAYEYALTDDQTCRIIYLFSIDTPLGEVPAQEEFRANAFTRVIPLTKANTEQKGYSVYSFRDAEFGIWMQYTP